MHQLIKYLVSLSLIVSPSHPVSFVPFKWFKEIDVATDYLVPATSLCLTEYGSCMDHDAIETDRKNSQGCWPGDQLKTSCLSFS